MFRLTARDAISVFAFLVPALPSPGSLAGAQPETPRVIRVAMDDAYAPYSFESGEGRLQGILVDQWQAWENKTGIKVEIRAMDWAEALRRMRAGEFDVIDSIVETPARRDYLDFTPAYATIEAPIFFRHDISGITGLSSLKGFPVAVKAGDQHIDTLEANGVTTVIQFPNNDAIIEAAKQRKINVFVVDAPSALYLLNKAGIEADFRQSAPIFQDQLRRAVRKGDVSLLRTVSEGFAAIDPAELRRIDEKWFGRTINRIGTYLTYAAYAAVVAILLIAGLAAWNRTLQRRILQRTAALGESEQRFRQLAENIHEVFWLLDMATRRVLYVSPAYEDIWGRTCASLYAKPRGWVDAIHPDDRARVQEAADTRQASGTYDEEYRIIRPDDSIGWIHDRAFPVRNAAGEFYRIAGVAEDITESRRVQAELRAVGQQLHALVARLNTVREEEAKRIARELHDDLGQRLTALDLELTDLERKLADTTPDQRAQLERIHTVVDHTIEAVQEMSSALRLGQLDVLGLTAAVDWQVKEFSRRSAIPSTVTRLDEIPSLSDAQRTAVFRILQEALTNIVRHAGATEVVIRLEAGPDQLVLTVRDNGRGITAAELGDRRAIGLLGMRERAQAVGGDVTVTGGAGVGTTVLVTIPLRAEGAMRV